MPSATAPVWRGRAWSDWVTLACRIILGGVIFAAGVLKVGDLEGSARTVRRYQILPYDLAGFVGYALPWIEVALGLLLIIGLFTRVTGALGALMMAVYIGAIASLWARHMSLDCGCFGNGGVKDVFDPGAYALDIARDVALMALGIFAAWHPRSPLAAERALFGDPITPDQEYEE